MREIHIWITENDYENANLMILIGYILMGHPDWKYSQIKIFAIFPEEGIQDQRKKLLELAKEGRLPISSNNIGVISKVDGKTNRDLINETSSAADLSIIGFRSEAIKQLGDEVFHGYYESGNILFVNARNEKEII